MLYLNGDALDWFLWAKEHKKFDSWGHFKHKLVEQFNSVELSLAYQGSRSLLLEGSVFVYRLEFKRFSSQLAGLPLKLLEPVKPEIDMVNPLELVSIMDTPLKAEKTY